ncbi:hypothetical protein FACS1894166_11150 [Bacilli bacterium]|nr:hypothetical protein FACS1894166_11150 [Bacilli bacterium]
MVEKMLIQCFQLIVQELVKEVFDARNFPNEFAPNSVILTNKKRKLETLGETTTQREISFSPISLLSHSKEEFMEIINHEVTHLVHFNHSILFYHANGQD